MAAVKGKGGKNKVRKQYEDYPYPYRDPKDEKKRLITGSPSQLREIGPLSIQWTDACRKTFRILVAGGGTGDALIMLAQQCHDAGFEPDIHYLDLSKASRAVAEKRAKTRKLKNITFHTGSLMEASELGQFDYIDCCGVLHHLPVPGEGFAALKAALKPDGGMGIMVYGEAGRTGVYHVQNMLRQISSKEKSAEQVDIAKKLIAELPETNWLKRNSQVQDHKGDDADLYDLLLHSQDRAYDVLQLADLVAASGLRIVSFIDPARYNPDFMIKSPDLRQRLRNLDPVQRASFAELFSGNIRKHIVYLTHKERDEQTMASCGDPDAVPVFKDEMTKGMLHQMPPGAQPNVEADGMSIALPLPPQAALVLRAIDEKRSLEEIRKMMPGQPDWSAFSITFDQIFTLLNGVGMLFLCWKA